MKQLLSISLIWFSISTYAQDSLVDIDGKISISEILHSRPTSSLKQFSANDINGKSIILDSLSGRPYVLNVWATWCEPCVAEIPTFNKLFESHKGCSVDFYAVSYSEDKKTTLKYFQKHQFLFKQLFAERNYIDTNRIVVGLPTTLFVDKSGTVVYSFNGGFPDPTKQEETIKKFKLGLEALGCR